MSVTIQGVTPATYDPSLDFASDIELVKRALDGNIGAAAKLCHDGADFLVQARTTTNDSSTSVIELMTARGVPFPAGFVRLVEWDVFASGEGATEVVWLRRQAFVTGGTTPVLVAVTTLSGVTGTADQVLSGSLGAGITTPASTLSVGAGVVNINIASGDTGETVNWTLRIRVGKLVPILQVA